jgi:hypothetical protein
MRSRPCRRWREPGPGLIDSVAAAKKVFQQQLGSTLEVVAKDVKLQVDFDPAMVARYRLVGYENRDVKDATFATTRSMPARSARATRSPRCTRSS